MREYRKNNKKRLNEYCKKRNIEHRLRLVKLLGSKCSNNKCMTNNNGCDDVRCLQLDHINGKGTQERKKLKGYVLYKYYLDRPELAKETLQVLCANCNWIKRYEEGEIGIN